MSASSLAPALTLILLAGPAGAAGGRPSSAGAAAEGPAPSPMSVPAALKLRSLTLEASGVVWAAALARYLIVSDDTGGAHDHHQPWVLAMDARGVLDPEPVAIAGIDELNDAESICAGPDGTFILATSHSPNRKGRLSPARRMVLLLALDVKGGQEGRGGQPMRALRVIGRIDLTSARDRAGRSLPELAGLPAEGRLDIEAVSYRDGALLVGLKSPLTAGGGAVVLRLAAPIEALRAGRIAAGSLARLWELQLRENPGHVPQGIADLTSLPDGTVALVANSPKGGERDGGGGLYWFDPKANRLELLHRFENLRPEGVTLAADGRALVVVFDTDDQAPLWTRWPLPAQARAR